jgi:choline dehydrogenase
LSRYDYVVIGAGSAGCPLAARLSENGAEVLLLEAGGEDTTEELHVPPAWPTHWGTDVDWSYETTPQLGTGNLPHNWPRGKVLGGSSTINAMVYLRGHRNDFDNWAAGGATGWDYEGVLPYFKKLETVEGKDPEYRGTSGPMRPKIAADPNPLSEVFLDAAKELGYPTTDDFNGAVQEGAGWHELTIVDGKRQSTALAYLHPAIDRPNLTVLTRAHALRLTFDGGKRCTGVEYERGGSVETATAEGEVIVCGGTVNSPQLLLLSGVGPADHLREIGVDVVHDLPGVGENLHDHPLLGLVFKADGEIAPGKTNHAETSMLWRSDPSLDGPDMQFMFIHVPFHPPHLQAPPNSYTFGIATIPDSRGWIRLASKDPKAAPLINPNYLGEDSDVRRLLLGIEKARNLNASSAFSEWGTTEVLAGEHVQDEAGLRDFVSRGTGTYYHPVGTCKIGADDGAVVDPDLRVRGIEGLRVADASVMPTVVCVNTNAASIMIGEKAADLVLGTGPREVGEAQTA